jgi:hypothetical protein
MKDSQRKAMWAKRMRRIGKTTGKFALSKGFYTREQKDGHVKYTYPFKTTEEAEDYFLGADPRKHKDYKRLMKK